MSIGRKINKRKLLEVESPGWLFQRGN
jgi:hypothetical protein